LGFHSNRSGAFQIWTIAPDGSDLRQLTRLANRGTVYSSMWSPDGTRLAFNVEGRPPMIIETGKPWDERSLENLPPLESSDALFVANSWSPDRRLLAGHRVVATAHDGISVYSFNSRQYKNFTDFGWAPRWLSDGQRLIFWHFPGIYLLDTGSGKVHQILSASPNRVMGASPSRDDRRIYFGLVTVEADVWLMSRE